MTLVRICGLCPRKDYWKDRAEPMEIAETKVNIETTRKKRQVDRENDSFRASWSIPVAALSRGNPLKCGLNRLGQGF